MRLSYHLLQEALSPSWPTIRYTCGMHPQRQQLTAFHITRLNRAALAVTEHGLRLMLPSADATQYRNAMLDDYAGLRRADYHWRPPLRLQLRARASGALSGTAGFGFWNNPAELPPTLPAALWFFHAAPPSDLPLALGTAGNGWKAASIDATTPQALAWAPLAPAVLLLNQKRAWRRRIWPRVQRGLRIAEAAIPPLREEWHSYTIDWGVDHAHFAIDGQTVLETDRAPRGPLGFVAWLDNQWAIVTPTGRFGWGVSPSWRQWLDLDGIRIKAKD